MKYTSARSFRQALEERLRQNYPGKQIPRIRKMIAFERLMARLDDHWILKGGYAIQLRTLNARTTQDIDLLAVELSSGEIEKAFGNALDKELGDYFGFSIVSTGIISAERAFRFQVITRVAGRVFEKFHVDIGYKDPLLHPTDFIQPPNLLCFAEIESLRIPCYSIYQHIAEKVHAIWQPRQTPSSRVKDLVDLILMASLDSNLSADTLYAAITSVFQNRGDQAPDTLGSFPTDWEQRYRRLASDVQLQLQEFTEGTRLAGRFINPILSKEVVGLSWNPEKWCWE
jgi:hypothetical protein